MQECGFSLSECRNLFVITAVLKNFFVGIFEQKLYILCVLHKTGFINLALQTGLNNGGIVRSQAAAPITREVMERNRPPHISRHGGSHGNNRIQPQFGFLGIKQFKRFFIRLACSQRGRIDTGFL